MMGGFVLIGAHMEDQGLLLQTDVDAVRMRDVMLTQFSMLSASDTLEDALQRSVHTLQDVFPVVRGANLVGAVSRQSIVEALADRRQRLRPGRDDAVVPDRAAGRLAGEDAAAHHGRDRARRWCRCSKATASSASLRRRIWPTRWAC